MTIGKMMFAKGTTPQDILDTIDASVVAYMGKKRELDEMAMRTLLHNDQELMESYMRKIERAVWAMIGAGVPAKFFGK